MKSLSFNLRYAVAVLGCAVIVSSQAQAPDGPPRGEMRGPGGFGGVREKEKLVARFDKDGDGRLNSAERHAALESLAQNQGRGARRGGPRFGRPGEDQTPGTPGEKISSADVKSFPDLPFYDPRAFRTFFIEFEDADWEKQMASFKNTDVEVPARITVDGKVYNDVGIHFRGMSSFMMVGEGRKRSLGLSFDFAHKDQNIGGYRSLNLLNSHEDPTFLRSVLSYQIDREYLPAAKANFVRVVINGESWGVYVNVEQFNKDFVKEWFGTTKGARWKVPGSPGGQGSLAYLGDDAAPYKRIYEIKTKDDPKSWSDLIKLCKVLNETPPDKLEAALAPLLDIDGALKFLALDNALINNDGYWIRTSDYSIYEDVKGQFHVLPQDSNETFLRPESPGGPGGPGGPRGPGGRGGFGPGMFLAREIMDQGDKNQDQKLSPTEFAAVADSWFDQMDASKTGSVSQDQFVEKFGDILGPPPGGPRGGPPDDGPRPGGPGGPGGFGPGRFVGPALFDAADLDKNGALTRPELKASFAKWFSTWDADKSNALDEEKLRAGLNQILPRPGFGGPGRMAGGPGGRPGGGGPGFPGGLSVKGVELDPLVVANDPNKVLASKLLAVPALRARYLAYVHDIADKWLDWKKLGPIALQYSTLIADDVKKDTRKLNSFEAFTKGVAQEATTESGEDREPISLKNFADQRRAFLLNYRETKKISN